MKSLEAKEDESCSREYWEYLWSTPEILSYLSHKSKPIPTLILFFNSLNISMLLIFIEILVLIDIFNMLKFHIKLDDDLVQSEWWNGGLYARVVPRYHEVDRNICIVLIDIFNMLKFHPKTRWK